MAESIKYIGASTHDLDLFEGQYSIPNGMAYNSYVIDDEKIAKKRLTAESLNIS